jgi:hypothetical protein
MILLQAVDDGWNVIVSIGGDGTHNEVVNGYLQVDAKQVLYCLPWYLWLISALTRVVSCVCMMLAWVIETSRNGNHVLWHWW